MGPSISNTTEHYSYSRISTYEQCPYKFKRVYIDGVEMKPSWQMFLGTSAADILEHIHKVGLEPLDALVEKYWVPLQYQELQKQSQEPVYKFLGYSTEKEAQQSKKHLIKFLKEFFEYYGTEKLFGVEVPFEFTQDGVTFTGRIDMLKKVGANTLVIIDNKLTSRYLDVNDSMQLTLYYLAVRKLLPRFSISHIGYYYFRFAKEVLLDTKLLNVSKILDKMLSIVDSIRSQVFVKQYSNLCNYCHLKEECN